MEHKQIYHGAFLNNEDINEERESRTEFIITLLYYTYVLEGI